MQNPLRPRNSSAATWDPAAPPAEEFATSAPAILPGVPLGRAALSLQSDPTVPVAQSSAAPETPDVPVPATVPAAPAAGPPAGWYREPSGRPGQRYWDGRAWTEHTAA